MTKHDTLNCLNNVYHEEDIYKEFRGAILIVKINHGLQHVIAFRFLMLKKQSDQGKWGMITGIKGFY